MTESYYFGAYWSSRAESRQACAARLLQMMTELESCHELLASWNQLAGSLRKALERHITPSLDSLTTLFKGEKLKRFKEHGYKFNAWNGRPESAESIGLSITCGATPPQPVWGNRVVLDLPWPADAVPTLYEPDVLLGILRAIVCAWEPDWAMLMSVSYQMQDVDGGRDQPHEDESHEDKPDVGWMTYLRAKRLHGLTTPPPCEQIDIPDRGAIFVVTRDHRFSVENPDDIARAQTLTAYLEACGALMPVSPTEPF